MSFEEFLSRYEKVPVVQYPNRVNSCPKVSVIVVTYQHANFIKTCLDGILMQKTNFDFEILLGEDASTDGTREICIEYAEKYPDRIKLFLHKRENNINILGPTGRFNFIYNFFCAKGKYIALCEGDDYWTDPKKLQKQVDFLEEKSNYSFCFHTITKVDVNGKLLKTDQSPANSLYPLTDFSSEQILAYGMLINTCSLLFRYSDFVLDSIAKAPLLPFADKTLEKLLALNGSGYFFRDSMACYRVNTLSVSQAKEWKEYGRFNHYKDHINLYLYLKEKTNSNFKIEVINKVISWYSKSENKSQLKWRFSKEAFVLVYIAFNKNFFYLTRYFFREILNLIKRFILKKILNRY